MALSEDGELALGRQALKSKRTREKILQSAISLIKEGGFSSASASRIAERAGMTWGAAQHHFGSKEEILDAVTMISHEQFTALMKTPDLRQGSLSDRVDLFVDRMWAHYQTDLFLASQEILLASRSGDQAAAKLAMFERTAREHVATLREIFFDTELDDEHIQEALIFIHCLLTGLAIEKVLETEVRNVDRHIRRGKLMLLTILSNV